MVRAWIVDLPTWAAPQPVIMRPLTASLYQAAGPSFPFQLASCNYLTLTFGLATLLYLLSTLRFNVFFHVVLFSAAGHWRTMLDQPATSDPVHRLILQLLNIILLIHASRLLQKAGGGPLGNELPSPHPQVFQCPEETSKAGPR